jgi:hypothetical protein
MLRHHFRPVRLGCLVLSACVLMTGGCSQPRSASIEKSANQAALNHVVLVSLKDPADTQQLLADCHRLLPLIPTVRTWWIGTPVDTGRAKVDDAYEVGLCVGFEDEAGLQAYLVDPLHLELVDEWGPKASQFRIFDIGLDPNGR